VATSVDEAYQVLLLGAIPNLLGDYANAVGRETAAQLRYLELGGIVFDYQFVWSMSRGTTAFFDDALQAYGQIILMSDRLDDIGNPVALTANWFQTTPPSVVTSSVETQDEETRYPTRVHYRHAHVGAFNEFVGAAAGGDYPATVNEMRSSGSKSLRLRLRLDDEHAFMVGFHLATDSAFPSEGFSISATLMFVGSLYWRAVY
jgi:hypothetical protein